MKSVKEKMSWSDAAFASFQNDIKDHSMEVLMDNGLYRHLRFSKDGSNVFRFDLVTWPGHLSITGDMESFTFSRLDDMFSFFRTDRVAKPGGKFDPEKNTNLGYWAEKVVAQAPGGITKLYGQKIANAIKSYVEDDEEGVERFGKDEWTEIKEEVRDLEQRAMNDPDSELKELVSDIYDFECNGFSFVDFWDHRLEAYTYHFAWSCAAIAYGVREYDLHMGAKAAVQLAQEVLPDEVKMSGTLGADEVLALSQVDSRAVQFTDDGNGVFILAPLSADQVRKVESGEIKNGFDVKPSECVAFDEAAGLYLMGVYSKGQGTSKTLMEKFNSFLRKLPQDLPVFAKGSTQEGRNWMSKNGFKPVFEDGAIQMSDTQSLTRVDANEALPSPPTKKKISPSLW